MAGLAALEESGALLAAFDPDAVTAELVGAALVLVQTQCQLAEARRLALVRRAEAEGLHRGGGAAHAVPWAAGVLKVSQRTVGRLRRLTRSLQVVPLIREAFNAGQINAEQAQAMADAM